MNEQYSHLVCPHCQATNRVPAAKLNDAPNCGKCSQPLLTASPHELDGQTVSKFIQKNDVLTIVDFWASWCQPCLMMAPQFKAAASQLSQVVFAKVQTDKYEQAAAQTKMQASDLVANTYDAVWTWAKAMQAHLKKNPNFLPRIS